MIQSAQPNFAKRHIPNLLTVSRLAMGIYFPFFNDTWRAWVVALALATEFFDGFLSRRWHVESSFGRMLDPLADKVFILTMTATLVIEKSIDPDELLLIGARDIMVIFGIAYVILSGSWQRFLRMRPSMLGKITTTLQFFYLIYFIFVGEKEPLLFLATATMSTIAAAEYFILFWFIKKYDA